MPTMMTDFRDDIDVGSVAGTMKTGILAKSAPSRRNLLSRGRLISRWHRTADVGRGNSTLPTIDGNQMFLVLIVAREPADGGGPVPSRPTEQRPLMLQPESSSAGLGLTARQRDVLALMLQGKSNKAICRGLNLAESTVKNHISAIFKAFKVTNRTEAVIAANTSGWHSSSVRMRPSHDHRGITLAVLRFTTVRFLYLKATPSGIGGTRKRSRSGCGSVPGRTHVGNGLCAHETRSRATGALAPEKSRPHVANVTRFPIAEILL